MSPYLIMAGIVTTCIVADTVINYLNYRFVKQSASFINYSTEETGIEYMDTPEPQPSKQEIQEALQRLAHNYAETAQFTQVAHHPDPYEDDSIEYLEEWEEKKIEQRKRGF